MKSRILLVDDEPDILVTLQDAVVKLLEMPAGVDTAASGTEARSRIEGGAGYDMVVTDERMPGMRGVELLEWLRGARPRTVRVLMTAHREGGIGQDAVNRAQAHLFIYKPFELAEMLPALRRALQEKHRRDEQQRSLDRALKVFQKLSREV